VDKAATDATLTTDVKARLADDEIVKARQIDVDTDNGIVTLRGTVDSEAEAQQAVKIASNVEGVRSVRSFLKVDTANASDSDNNVDTDHDTSSSVKQEVDKIGDEAKDAAITTSVKMKLAADDKVKASTIDVDTENGVVTLNGHVESKAEESRAIKIAKSVDNVRSVKSNLAVEPQTD
jgi:hyperosmotically inducible protein